MIVGQLRKLLEGRDTYDVIEIRPEGKERIYDVVEGWIDQYGDVILKARAR